MKTVLFRTNGDIRVVSVNPEAPSFQEFQRITGQGWAEYVTPRFGGREAERIVIVCDDEGRLKGYGMNVFASYLYGTHVHGSPIVGDVILMQPGMTDEGPGFSFYKDEEIRGLVETIRSIVSRINCKFNFIEEE